MLSVLHISESDMKVIKAQLDKLMPSSQAVLKDMLIQGQAYVKEGKMYIDPFYRSRILTFQLKKDHSADEHDE